MNEKINFKENLSQEEIDSLSAILYSNMKDFFKTELGKKFLEENLYKTNQSHEKSA